MRKVLLITVLLCLWPAAAHAKYLHQSDARKAAERWLPYWAGQLDSKPGSIEQCFRSSAHAVVCKYRLLGTIIDGEQVLWFESWTVVSLGRRHTLVHDPGFR